VKRFIYASFLQEAAELLARPRLNELAERVVITPQNLSVQYRLAYLDFASGSPERSLPVFVALAANRAASRSIRSMSLLYAARAHDLAGRRQDAVRAYQRVADSYDDQRAADFARVGLLSPYRGRSLRTAAPPVTSAWSRSKQ